MTKKKHTHQYRKVKLVNSVVYRCVLPGCTHYLRAPFIVGQLAKCWYCPNEFMITQKLAQLERVHCDNCTVRRKPKLEVKDAVNFLEILNDESTG